jgi:hypothetical protein
MSKAGRKGNGDEKDDGGNGGGNGGAPGIPFTPGNPYRWKSGQSGNPRGLAVDPLKMDKYKRIKPRLDDKLLDYWDAPCDVKPFAGLGMSWGEVWVRALYVNGIRGRPTAIRELHERIWGKVALPIKLTMGTELSDEARLLQAMTEAELEELERISTLAAQGEERLLDLARQRLGEAPIDVPAKTVEPKAKR